jgi:predicted DCC family thiol-disulfide oxidoreductase YuxK
MHGGEALKTSVSLLVTARLAGQTADPLPIDDFEYSLIRSEQNRYYLMGEENNCIQGAKSTRSFF